MPGKRKRGAEASKLEGELGSLTPSQIREELRAVGEDVGPVDSSNKDIYIRMLARKKQKLETSAVSTASSETAASTGNGSRSSSSPASYPRSVTTPRGALARKPLTKASPGPSPPVPTSEMIPGIGVVVSPDQPVSKKVVRSSVAGRSPAKPLSKKAGLTSPTLLDSPLTKKRTAPKLTASTSSLSRNLQAIRDFKVEGLTAATFTPFDDEGELNLSAIGKYVNWLLETGVKNVFLNGTTGESLSLTVEERKIITEEWVQVAAGRLTVIVHVGTENLKNTCELAEHAEKVGADAIGVMPTTFFKPASIDHLTLYLQKVGECAPTLPMYYYHIPSMTGVNFSMEDFLEVAGPRLPTLRGLKYTSQDLMEFGRCVTAQAERYQIIYGSDQQVIGALSLGGIAAIGSTYNYAGKLYNRLFSAFKRRDTEAAKLEQRRSQAMIKLLFKYGSHAGGGKAFMKLCGVDLGPPRLPVLPLTPENVRGLETDLRDIGYFEWS